MCWPYTQNELPAGHPHRRAPLEWPHVRHPLFYRSAATTYLVRTAKEAQRLDVRSKQLIKVSRTHPQGRKINLRASQLGGQGCQVRSASASPPEEQKVRPLARSDLYGGGDGERLVPRCGEDREKHPPQARTTRKLMSWNMGGVGGDDSSAGGQPGSASVKSGVALSADGSIHACHPPNGGGRWVD